MTSQIQVSQQQALFVRIALNALIRAEADGRVPARFSGTGPEIWRTFSNELSIANLAAITIQDTGATMPIPFAPEKWWPDWPVWTLLQIPDQDVEIWVQEALSNHEQPQQSFLRQQAALLGISLPEEAVLADLDTPAAHERWLELPGTAGWVSYTFCTRQDADLYYWENFTILCDTAEEMLLAGIIAWELGAPPNTRLPILLEDQTLSSTLQAGRKYDGIVGIHTLHHHRDLRALHKEGKTPVWV
ncbi:MAG: hypothetical protein JW908_09100 [Anaerolineales bacterium]|nr:hypothetical protein [Anaerolineales bacterium]